jgi:hypothetical protein
MTMGENYGPAPAHGPEHERLGVFVGTWHAEGLSYGRDQDRNDPRAHAEPWVSDEITAWHAGKFFIIQDEDAKTGPASLVTHAVLGYDPATGAYVAHTFENHGFSRQYAVRVDGRIWTFSGDTERARIEFSEDGQKQSVRWEWRPVDQTWLPLCDRTNVRVA